MKYRICRVPIHESMKKPNTESHTLDEKSRYRSILANCTDISLSCERGLCDTYCEPYVAPVHEEKDEAANASVIQTVTEYEERDGHDVVGHHLDMVLPSGLCVEDEDGVEPESELREVVELDAAGKWNVRVVDPEVLEAPRGVGKVNVQVLRWNASIRTTGRFCLEKLTQP